VRPPYWELRRLGVGRTKNPTVCGRKLCPRCGRWRHLVDFPARPSRDRPEWRPASYCRVCERASARERYARWTPEQRELWREYRRIWSEAKAREAGRQTYQRRRSTAVDRIERVFLPREPIARELALLNGELATLSKRSGVSERTIGRIIAGESRHVRIDVADKLAVAIGKSAAQLWGEDW
jgi:Helix-turn-helix